MGNNTIKMNVKTVAININILYTILLAAVV